MAAAAAVAENAKMVSLERKKYFHTLRWNNSIYVLLSNTTP